MQFLPTFLIYKFYKRKNLKILTAFCGGKKRKMTHSLEYTQESRQTAGVLKCSCDVDTYVYALAAHVRGNDDTGL